MKYYLVKQWIAQNTYHTSWFQSIASGFWKNYNGGESPKDEDDIVLEACDVDYIEDLDWLKTDLSKPQSNCGWLSPIGVYHGCSSTDHYIYADLVLHYTQDELYNLGWAKVMAYVTYFDESPLVCPMTFLTEKQVKWAINRNMILDEHHIIMFYDDFIVKEYFFNCWKEVTQLQGGCI